MRPSGYAPYLIKALLGLVSGSWVHETAGQGSIGCGQQKKGLGQRCRQECGVGDDTRTQPLEKMKCEQAQEDCMLSTPRGWSAKDHECKERNGRIHYAKQEAASCSNLSC